jgi:GntR family transcriptional regulator
LASLSEIIGPIDADHRQPLYQQLQRALRDAIEKRVWGPDDALPAERDLADEFSISRITVRKALDGLVSEGLLMRKQGAGTFVAGRVEKNFSKLTSFSEDMIARGRKPHSEWISKAEGSVTPEECLSLGLSPGSAVYRFDRIRYADESPMALEFSTVPAYCLPSVEAVGDSLYSALEKAGGRPMRALQRLRAVLFTTEQARLLHVEPGDAGLLIERRGFLKNGQPVEITRSWYRGDAYDFVAELSAI